LEQEEMAEPQETLSRTALMAVTQYFQPLHQRVVVVEVRLLVMVEAVVQAVVVLLMLEQVELLARLGKEVMVETVEILALAEAAVPVLLVAHGMVLMDQIMVGMVYSPLLLGRQLITLEVAVEV
jgi:hypothetical protein